MVKHALAVVVVLQILGMRVQPAAAHPALPDRVYIVEPPPPPPPPPPPKEEKRRDDGLDGKLGFRIDFGQIPVANKPLFEIGLGLAVEGRLAGRWRMYGSYAWMWVDDARTPGTRRLGMPDDTLDHTGHRLEAGLRHVLAAKTFAKEIRLYADVELGGGVSIVELPPMFGPEVAIIPHGVVGLRFGYAFIQKENKASKSWEPELLVRATVVPDGVGISGGVGMLWD